MATATIDGDFGSGAAFPSVEDLQLIFLETEPQTNTIDELSLSLSLLVSLRLLNKRLFAAAKLPMPICSL